MDVLNDVNRLRVELAWTRALCVYCCLIPSNCWNQIIATVIQTEHLFDHSPDITLDTAISDEETQRQTPIMRS